MMTMAAPSKTGTPVKGRGPHGALRPKNGNGTAPSQSELALDTVLSHKLFPGRTTLMVPEVAKALGIDEKHLISLIDEGLMDAIEITGRGNKSSREHWRIPVSGYDKYVRERWNNRPEGKR
jgi:hypothetical protein